MKPTISVIIRNRNEAKYLKTVLRALSLQTIKPEIIIVDNHSADDSLSIAREYDCTICEISNFTYGKALNIGLAAATTEICVILSAHSLPLGTTFLSECLKPFADSKIAAARCVYAGKGADLTRWCEPKLLDQTSDFISYGILASGCVVHRSVWERIPFDEDVTAAEDKFWSEAVLKSGASILSPIPAFYFYLKPMKPVDKLRKNYLEIVAVNKKTDKTLGFVKVSKLTALADLLSGIFVSAPRAAFSVLHTEAVKAKLRLSFPK